MEKHKTEIKKTKKEEEQEEKKKKMTVICGTAPIFSARCKMFFLCQSDPEVFIVDFISNPLHHIIHDKYCDIICN